MNWKGYKEMIATLFEVQ